MVQLGYPRKVRLTLRVAKNCAAAHSPWCPRRSEEEAGPLAEVDVGWDAEAPLRGAFLKFLDATGLRPDCDHATCRLFGILRAPRDRTEELRFFDFMALGQAGYLSEGGTPQSQKLGSGTVIRVSRKALKSIETPPRAPYCHTKQPAGARQVGTLTASQAQNMGEAKMEERGGAGAGDEPALDLTEAEKDKQCVALKDQGNAAYKAKEYVHAIELYSQALELDPVAAVLFSNRCTAHLAQLAKLGPGQEKDLHVIRALVDACACQRWSTAWDRAYYRLGCAFAAAGDKDQAAAELNKGLALNPQNPEILAKLKELRASATAPPRVTEGLQDSQARTQTAPSPEAVQPGPHSSEPARERDGKEDKALGRPEVQALPVDTPLAPAGLASWARGMSEEKQYEWLLDCYRLRESLDAAGPNWAYHAESCQQLGLFAFLVFCVLSARQGALPARWDWRKFLSRLSSGQSGKDRSAGRDLWRKGWDNEMRKRYGKAALADSRGPQDPPSLVVLARSLVGSEPGGAWPVQQCSIRDEVEAVFHDLASEKSKAFLEVVGGHAAWDKLKKLEPVGTCHCA